MEQQDKHPLSISTILKQKRPARFWLSFFFAKSYPQHYQLYAILFYICPASGDQLLPNLPRVETQQGHGG